MKKTTVADIMQVNVFSVAPDQLLHEVEVELTRRRIGGAPVVSNAELLGMISRFDIVRALGFEHGIADVLVDYCRQLEGLPRGLAPSEAAESLADSALGHRLRELRVRDVMTRSPCTVPGTTSVEEGARVMVEQRIHRLLVVDQGRVSGVLSTVDVMRWLGAKAPRAEATSGGHGALEARDENQLERK